MSRRLDEIRERWADAERNDDRHDPSRHADIAHLLALVDDARRVLVDAGGGGLGIRTAPDQLCWFCQRTDGLALHTQDCDLAALLQRMGGDDGTR